MTSNSVRRPDASMDVLRRIREEALEPEYLQSHASDPGDRSGSHTRRLGVFIVFGLIGILLAAALVHTQNQAVTASKARQELVGRTGQLQAKVERQRSEVAELERRVDQLQTASVPQALQTELDQAQLAAGATGLTGPGLSITVDDSPREQQENGQVIDQDLAQLVNGLFEAGAEAVAINGKRITSVTAIRSAGEAITVNYESLTRPYVVTAIGGKNSFAAEFNQTGGAAWWEYLRQNYGLDFSIESKDDVVVPADETLTLRFAEKAEN